MYVSFCQPSYCALGSRTVYQLICWCVSLKNYAYAHIHTCHIYVSDIHSGAPGTVDVGPNIGVIVGSVLAAAGVSIFSMVIIIVIVKKRRKKHNNETSTANVATAEHYANVIVGNPDAVCKITTRSITEKNTAYSDIGEASLQRGVMEPFVPVQNVYEKLQDVTESSESAYCTRDHTRINDQIMESIKTCSTFVETLQSLESTLKSVEEEIIVLLDKKEQFLSKELETARTNKLRDKWKKKDSDKDKDNTSVNYVQALQSIEEELRILEEKRKCLLGKKEILLRQELAKTTENEE
ncbi:hypothetical protein ACJMK2_032012 [Sinanodonta woodiana]|uniref:Uncharacterized protein n=1 Tax=Sinanodonta woodiana TaxID=1069815 RepID=A0ABD3X0F5_SINWO